MTQGDLGARQTWSTAPGPISGLFIRSVHGTSHGRHAAICSRLEVAASPATDESRLLKTRCRSWRTCRIRRGAGRNQHPAPHVEFPKCRGASAIDKGWGVVERAKANQFPGHNARVVSQVHACRERRAISPRNWRAGFLSMPNLSFRRCQSSPGSDRYPTAPPQSII